MPSSEDGGDGGKDDDFSVDVTGCKTGKNSALHGTTVKVLKTVGKSYVVEDADGAQHQVQIRSTTPSPKKGTKKHEGGDGAKKPQPLSPRSKQGVGALLVDVTGCKTGANSALHGTTVKVLETVGKSYVVVDEDGAQHKVQIRATTPSPTKKKKGGSTEMSAPPAVAATESEGVLMVQVTGCKTGKNSALHGTTVKVLDSICKSYVVEDAGGAQHRVQKRFTMPMWNFEDGAQYLDSDCDFDCGLLRPLLPIPPAVQFFLDDNDDPEVTDVAWITTMWLVAAVQCAYLSPLIKAAGRELMTCSAFMGELGWEDGECAYWGDFLIPKLQQTLAALGRKAKQINLDCDLARKVTESKILEVALYNPALLPDGAASGGGGGAIGECMPRDSIRQDRLMPSMAASASTHYERDWKMHPEHIYIHMLLLIATALDPLFAAALRRLLGGIEGIELIKAPIKSFTRMINKLMTADDHRHDVKPRPAMNIDIVRMLASCTSPEGIIELVIKVAEEFGGLSYMKCLPELAFSDPPAAEARYHMLPVMITVVFAPHGLTVGSLLKDPKVRAAWAKLRETRPSADVCTEQWQLDHDTAVNMLETKCDPNEAVQMHCEVQVVTEELKEVRHSMHEVYKVVRASNADQLKADVAKPADEVADFADCHSPEEELVVAAGKGRIATVKRLLKGNAGDGGDDGGNGAVVNTDWMGEDGTSPTALWVAASCGHLPVVLQLLEHKADPNKEPAFGQVSEGEFRCRSLPLFAAADGGHVEIAKALLEYNATPGKIYTEHADVMEVLLENDTETDDEALAQFEIDSAEESVRENHIEVLKVFMKRFNGQPGLTHLVPSLMPLAIESDAHLADGKKKTGNMKIVKMLLKHEADPNLVTMNDDGVEKTPMQLATEMGNQDIIEVLRQHGGCCEVANVNALV